MRVDYAGVDIGDDGFAGDQGGELLIDVLVCLGNDLTNDLIAAGGQPECFWFAAAVKVVDHGPGVEDFRFAKPIAVIPFADLIILLRHRVVRRHLLHLVRGKSEVCAVLVVQNRIDGDVVESAENALLGNAKDTGEEPKGEVRVILQASGEQVAHEANDLVVVTKGMPLLDRGVVLIDDNNGCNLIMGMEHPGQIQEDHGHI